MPALGKGDLQAAGQLSLLHVATAAAGGADADQIHRAMADVVIAVAAEIFGREFPVAWDPPFLDTAQDLGAAIGAVPAVEGQVEIVNEIAEIFEKGRCRRIPAGPDGAFVEAHLRHLDQSPLRFVELGAVGLLEIRDADELTIGAVAPAVIGAGADGRVALVVAADLHAAMTAGVEEDTRLLRAIAAEDHRLFAHARHEIVARVRDLAFVANEQPSAGENAFELLLVDLVVDEDLAADLAGLHVHQIGPISPCA